MTHRLTTMPILSKFAAALISILPFVGSAAMAAPYDGSSAANAGLSAAQILKDYAASTTGLYWIDFDGAGAGAAQLIYADMTTAGGGWMLVRHSAATGGWINVNDSLRGTASLNTALATDPLAAASWTIPFSSTGADKYLFMTGDQTTWGVLAGADVLRNTAEPYTPNATVLAPQGTAVAAGGLTNVLNRTTNVEDPWIGFEGTHQQNIPKMMYGEANFGGAHVTFKNAHQGANVFVRELNPLAAPVPEPGTFGMLALGGLVVAAVARRRRPR